MDETQRLRWLCDTTRSQSYRGIARRMGVTHPTVQRWVKRGIPLEKVGDMVARFHADPIRAMVVAGVLKDEDVPRLNYQALVEYMPVEILAAELDRRVTRYVTVCQDSMRRGSAFRAPAGVRPVVALNEAR